MKTGSIPENAAEHKMLADGLVPTPFFDTHFSALLARTILVAIKLDVFEALASGAAVADQIATHCKLHAGATERLLNALASAAYLSLNKRSYALTPIAREWLLKESPRSIRDYILQLELCEWKWIEHYEDFVRTGKSIRIHENMSDEQWHLYQRGMRALASFSAPEVAERTPVPEGARNMLDIGGSHGYFSVAICRRHPELSSIVFDLPKAVEHAAQLLAKEGMGDRVIHRAGDIVADDFGTDEFDLVFFSHVAHHFDEAANRELARRIERALRPGGFYVIVEGIRPESTSDGGQPALLLDLFCALTSEARTWSFDQMIEWQRDAGLVPHKSIMLDSAPGIGLQAARKCSQVPNA